MVSPRPRLRALYAEIDCHCADFLARTPRAACDPGCADCCRTEPPLVSRDEAELVREALVALPPGIRSGIRSRARALVQDVLARGGTTFTCPLLVEEAGGGRCAVYAARPHACRTFGHTARRGDAGDQAFTCPRILPRLGAARPPVVDFRSVALRQTVGVETITDSYLPVWVGLDPEEWEARPTGPRSAVVVPKGA